jgi:Ricin-type beta-trefoil lectin domain
MAAAGSPAAASAWLGDGTEWNACQADPAPGRHPQRTCTSATRQRLRQRASPAVGDVTDHPPDRKGKHEDPTRACRPAFTAATSTVVTLAAVQPADAANFFSIQNFGSGSCIQPPPDQSTATGAQLVQEPCNTDVAAQRWALNALGGGNYQILNQSTGGCLNAHGPNTDRTRVDTFPCSRISNQRWHIDPSIPHAVPTRIVSAIGGRCLDVSAGSSANDAPIQIYHCTNDNAAQAWLIH